MSLNHKDLWIIIPAWNAAPTIGKVLEDLKNLSLSADIVVIDDGSQDETSQLAIHGGAHVLRHATNKGYGASVKRGVAYALSQGGKIFVTLGADNQRDVRDILILAAALEAGTCDMVIGSKFLARNQGIPIERIWANLIIRSVFNALFGSHFTDVTSGFKIFNISVAGQLDRLSDDYSFDADLCVRIVKARLKYQEVPVRVYYHEHSTKMRHPFFVLIRILLLIVKKRFFDANVN